MRAMTAGSSMLAMIVSFPPQRAQPSIPTPNSSGNSPILLDADCCMGSDRTAAETPIAVLRQWHHLGLPLRQHRKLRLSDVFLSYCREDQTTVRRFAEALQREGLSVWWDQSLRSGEAYDKVTEAALREAGAVVVLWSRTSVDSRWVRAEATTADRRGTLMPVMIEPCERPIMFELTHTADLSHWKGETNDPAWRSFLTDVCRFIENGRKPAASDTTQTPVLAVAAVRGRTGLMIAASVTAVLVGAGVLWFLQHRGDTAVAAPPTSAAAQAPVTLAVLPFANLSADPAQEYFSDGLTEEILNQLAQIPALRLTGRTSSFSFKGKNEDLRTIGKTLDVANLLEGSVRRDGKQLRITAQLIRADDGSHMWSKTYDRGLDNVFAMQDEIAKDVAQALSVKLDVTTLNRAQGGTTNVEAYDRYLRWRNLFLSEQRDIAVIRQQEQLLREAVALDPQFALAWDNLARLLDIITTLSCMRDPGGCSADTAVERWKADAVQARKRVEALAPDSWMVQRHRAYSLWAEGKWPEAVAVAKGILDKGPFTLEHAEPYGDLLFSVGRIEEVVALIERVKAIEPLVPYVSRDLQWDLTAVGRLSEAEVEYQRSRSLDGSHDGPDFAAFLRLLAREDADLPTLRVLHGKVLKQREPNPPAFLRELGEKLHDRADMRALVRKAYTVHPDPMIQYFADALGDPELALAGMRAMWKGPSPSYGAYWGLYLLPHSGMRSLPGYKELMREVGLVDYWQKTGDWGDICRPVGKDDFECR
jgi:TolB-like protein